MRQDAVNEAVHTGKGDGEMRSARANLSAASRAALVGAVAGIILWSTGGPVGAQLVSGSDVTAGYVVFPKIVADPNGQIGLQTDTYVQLTNTNLLEDAAIECTWVDATGRCGGPNSACPGTPAAPCFDNSDCTVPGQVCVPCWNERDFTVLLTPGQPIAFRASEGQTDLPCFPISVNPLILPPGCAEPNEGGILPAGLVFQGELKCLQVTNFNEPGSPGIPAPRNDLKGEATIISGDGTVLTSAAYNAFGFTTNEIAFALGNGPLCLQPPLPDPCGAEECSKIYGGCPGVLILDHFFEGARIGLGDTPAFVRTNLTLTPCTERIFSGDDIRDQVVTAAQMLIYNEFEQRYSTSTRVQCYKDIPLADIDTKPGPADDAFSVFSVAVQGTLVGQTRIRGVAGLENDVGHGLIGVAQEFYRGAPLPGSPTGPLFDTAAFNLHGVGDRAQGDAVCR